MSPSDSISWTPETGRPVVDRAPDVVRRPVGPESVALLWRADQATRARVALQLQRQAGNRFVQGLVVQRDPSGGGALTDAQQWEKDWNDYSQHQNYFKGSDRPTGNR